MFIIFFIIILDEQHRKRPNSEHFKQNGLNAQKPCFQARKSSLLEKV